MDHFIRRRLFENRLGFIVLRCMTAVLVASSVLVIKASEVTAMDRGEERLLVELAPVTWRHELAWSLSSDDVLFGRIAGVTLLADGALAVADMQLGQVLLIAPDGSLLQTLPVSGEGPGRVTRLAGVCDWPPDRLLLVQAWPGRVEVVARDGIPQRSLVLGGRGEQSGLSTLMSLEQVAGQLAGVHVNVRILDNQRSMNTVRLSLFSDDLVPKIDVLRRSNVTVDRMGLVDETEMDFPADAWNIIDERRVVVAPDRSDYRLEIHDLDRGLREVFSRNIKPLARPTWEMEQLKSQFSLVVNGQRRAIDFVFFDTAQMIQKIAVVERRSLLLTTAYQYHELPPRATARLDLVDLQTGTVREVRLAIPVSSAHDQLRSLPNRDAVVLVNGSALPLEQSTGGISSHAVPAIEYWRFTKEDP